VEEQRDDAAEGLAVEEAGERGRVVGAEGREGGVAVVERVDGQPGRGEVDGGELDHPAGLTGEVVHDCDGAEDGGGGGGNPALGEDAEAPRVEETPRRARECSTQRGQNATPFFGVPVEPGRGLL
jgi:hypothetical protein